MFVHADISDTAAAVWNLKNRYCLVCGKFTELFQKHAVVLSEWNERERKIPFGYPGSLNVEQMIRQIYEDLQ